jgi:hypothetical protein
MSKQPVNNSVGDRGGGASSGIRLSLQGKLQGKKIGKEASQEEKTFCTRFIFSATCTTVRVSNSNSHSNSSSNSNSPTPPLPLRKQRRTCEGGQRGERVSHGPELIICQSSYKCRRIRRRSQSRMKRSRSVRVRSRVMVPRRVVHHGVVERGRILPTARSGLTRAHREKVRTGKWTRMPRLLTVPWTMGRARSCSNEACQGDRIAEGWWG